jgi:hypothetical protein
VVDVKNLFSGIAVIIDNEVDKIESPIYKIRCTITNSNIPVVAYDDIPSFETVPSLINASFIILDWDFLDTLKGMVGAAELEQQKQEEVIEFIKLLLDELFVPIFIFSGVDIGQVEDILSEKGLYNKERANRIFVKSKTDVESEEQLFQCIEEWLKQMPSIYAMKEWDNVFQKTKNSMFRDWYQYAPQWVSVIWNMLKADSCEVHNEFGDFLTRNIVNRIPGFDFEENLFALEGMSSVEELKKIIERERYIEYSGNAPVQAYTGDLYKAGKYYYLNIRAQCDLSRKDDTVNLYLIKGKALKDKDIVTEDIRVVSDGQLKFPDKAYSLEEIQEICRSATDEENGTTDKLQKLNNQFRKYRNLVFFNRGELLEKKPEVILACVAGGQIIKFEIELITKSFAEFKDKRIGRVLPPYITRIQQKCSQHIVREGTMPIPREIFNSFDE